MHEILRKRILRRLEALPEGKLYQILDYIEFVESRYGEPSAPPTGLQSFAERLEDRMRARSVVPSVMSGTMKVFGAAGKVLDEVSSVGRGFVEGIGEGLGPPTGPQAVGSAPGDGAGSGDGAIEEVAGSSERPSEAAPDAGVDVPRGPVLADDEDRPEPA
ncbi:MAG TPA: hypothetical protein VK837_11505 [Longimicrobiales bacterium]|nr:hypothetical protein [Longimicrobiales bacterium]